MVQVTTNLTTRESARRERFEPSANVTATNVQTAIQQVAAQAFSTPAIKTLTGVAPLTSPYAAQPTDEVLIVKQGAANPFTINVDWSQRKKALMVVAGDTPANFANITITPAAGQTQMATVNFSYVIKSSGGNIILTPLPDNTGAY